MSIFDTSLLMAILSGMLMVVLFVQRGQWWNTVQFFYYSLFLSSFFAADFMSDLLKKKSLARIVVALLIILLTLPLTVDVARIFSNFSLAASYIPDQEIEALSFLRSQPDGTVLTIKPKRASAAEFVPINQKDSPYISAYGHKTSYFEGEVFLQILGTDYKQRQKDVQNLNPNIYKNVDYIYMYNNRKIKKFPVLMKIIFENEAVTIYSVIRSKAISE